MSRQRPRIPGVTVYPRGRKWAFILYLEPDLLTGRRERLYQGGFESADAAWEAAIKAKAERDTGRYVKPSRRTVAAFMAEWLTSVKDTVKPTTYANYVENNDAYIVPVIGQRKLQDVTVPVLNAFYRHLSSEGRRKPDNNRLMYEYWSARRDVRDGLGPGPLEVSQHCGTSYYAARAAVSRYQHGRVPADRTPGLAPKSVKNVHRLIHRAFRDAVAWQYLTFNPAEHASVPRTARRGRNRPKPWTVDELAAWLRVAMTDRFAALWVLAATAGLRRSELAGAERDGLEMWGTCSRCQHRQPADRAPCEACGTDGLELHGTLVIADTRVVVDGKAEDSDGKSDDSVRTISLDPFTVAALLRYLATLDEERQAFGTAYPDHGKLMVYEDGRRLHPDTVTRRFNRLVDIAGVRHIRLHDVRHTYATLALDSGVSLKIVSDRIGHSDVTVTGQIYVHQSVGQDHEAARLIAGLIERAVKAAG